MKSKTYIAAIDSLFSSFKGNYVDSLAWLSKALEDNFGVVDMPIIDVENKIDIRSSMITEAVPVDYPKRPFMGLVDAPAQAEEIYFFPK